MLINTYFIVFYFILVQNCEQTLLRKSQLKALSFKLLGYFYTKIFQCTPLDLTSHFLMNPSKTEKENDIHMYLILMHTDIHLLHFERSLKVLVEIFQKVSRINQNNQNLNHVLRV